MKNGFITFRSVTYAQRAESVVRRDGIGVVLQRTPKWMEEMGCGYCLRMEPGQLQRAAALLRAAGVSYRRGYVRRDNGRTEEVAL